MSKFISQQPIILASGSLIRAKLLSSLGIEFSVIPSNCDEAEIKSSRQFDTVIDLGYQLAITKALNVSQHYPGQFVIAADQLCVINDRILDKPLNHATAVEHLHSLSGQKHQQISCVCIAFNSKVLWNYHDIAYLTVRPLSDTTIQNYLLSETPYNSCGAYQFETQGKWLFSEVEGRDDTILGLPLIALTNALIQLGAIAL